MNPGDHVPHIITARNVNGALHDGLWWLAIAGREEPSRNGPVLVAPGPVITHYSHPQERVLFGRTRDANPFFHLYEGIWMLAGRNDSGSVARFAKTMDVFADNGRLNGAYGYRWRHHFGYDQLVAIVEELTARPHSRRAVLTMWEPQDLIDSESSKDVPCNTQVYFGIDRYGLNMTVCNRSNDMIWGGYGANYVHMGMLQEVIAGALGVPVGSYYQMSNNFHIYPEREDTRRMVRKEKNGYTVTLDVSYPYDVGPASIAPVAMFAPGVAFPIDTFLAVAERLAADPYTTQPTDTPWVTEVFVPMMNAHALYKNGDIADAIAYLRQYCRAADWKTAGIEWLQRREAKRNAKAA